jgi:hypothetical protein
MPDCSQWSRGEGIPVERRGSAGDRVDLHHGGGQAVAPATSLRARGGRAGQMGRRRKNVRLRRHKGGTSDSGW